MPETIAHRERRQGGDLTSFPDGVVHLDLSICSNTLGPPDNALRALQEFASGRRRELVPPPYGADHTYTTAYASRLGVEVDDLVCGRGVTEFLVVLSRILADQDTALVTPEYTETMTRFSFASFYEPVTATRDTPASRLHRIAQAMQHHRFVLVSNPNNPLGLHIPRAQLLEVCKRNADSFLILDEEYVHLAPRGLSLAGTDLENVAVLQSSGKTFGITGTRAGVLWTRRADLRRAVAAQIPTWPLSLLDTAVATAAVQDRAWARHNLPRIRKHAQRLERVLTARFGDAVVPAQCHFRFVHLADPDSVARHMESHGIAVRAFDGRVRGRVSGIRLTTPTSEVHFALLERALATLP